MAKGNLEQRIIHIHEAGKVGELLLSINQLLDLVDAFVREAGAALQSAGEEKFYRRILPHGMLGCFRSGAHLINAASAQLATQSDSLKAAERERLALADEFEQAIEEVVQTVAAASTQLHATAESLVATAQQASKQSLSASQASEQAAGNMATIASASEEIAATLREIERQAQEATTTAQDAESEAGARMRPWHRSPRRRIRSVR